MFFLLLFSLFFQIFSISDSTKVIILGSGNPNPTPDRQGPAAVVISHNKVYMIDCGTGVVRQAVKANITMSQLTTLFITHLHSDHTIGYPDAILTPAETGRKTIFKVYGPPGIREMTKNLMKGYKEDRRIRFSSEPEISRKGYSVKVKEIFKEGEVYKDEIMKVIAFRVNHGSWKYSYGYRFESIDGKVIVFSGDTRYSDNIVKYGKNVDILVHEVYSEKGLSKRSRGWQKYHKYFHTSGSILGKIARIAKPKKLVLYHQIPMGESPSEVVEEIKRNYKGDVYYSNDLDVFE